MYLKKIIIAGFKSFADKVVITLDKGITGVVGPNGSGKSNIIDAVRWVMGEQNAKNLRGEKATDIIFAGSERRKGLGLAEVSLVFDNTDDSPFCPPEYRHEPEIVLTRRLYADSQREYLINKRPARFKDIIGFFASTGLGGRSYSMIQQGQVDRILNAKPEDVREILEEAAGTAMFKKRKAEAERKLESTRINLARIDDILAEVEKGLGTLATQVEKAREYQDVNNRLRDEEISLLAHNFKFFRDQLATTQAQLDGEQTKESQLIADLAAFEARHVELKGQLDDADPETQILQEKVASLRESIVRSQAAETNAKRRLESGAERVKNLASEIAEEDANLKVLEAQVDDAQAQMAEAERLAARLKDAIAHFENEASFTEEAAQTFQSRLDEANDEIRNIERLIDNSRLRSEQAEAGLGRLDSEIAEERRRIATLAAEIVAMAPDLEAITAKAGAVRAGLDDELRQKHALDADIEAKRQLSKIAHTRRDQLREAYHASKARFDSLSELEAGATDVAETVATLRAALSPDDQSRLVRGLLADYIGFAPNAKELPARATQAFERWAERLVVRDLTAFNDLVRAATRTGIGTLPVLVLSQLNLLPTKTTPEMMSAWADAAGAEPFAHYLQTSPDALRDFPGLEQLLGRLYLLPTVSLGTEDLADVPAGVMVFTSQGVAIFGQGDFVIGGRGAPGLLTRKTELAELATALKTVEADLGRTQAELDGLELAMAEARRLVAEIDSKLQNQNHDVLAITSERQALQQAVDRKKEQQEVAAAAQDKLQNQRGNLAGEIEAQAQNRLSLSRELASAKAERESIEQEAEELLDRQREMKRQLDAQRLDLARSSSRAEALKDGFISTRSQLELNQNKLTKRYEERHRVEHDIALARAELDQSKIDIEAFVRERDRADDEFKLRREASAGLLEEIRVVESRLKQLRDQQLAMQRTLVEKGGELERLRMSVAGQAAQAAEKYRLDLSTHEFTYEADFNHDAKSRAVSRLRTKLDGMGAINMMALKEYEEKSERRDFIARQREEVMSSIDLLMAAIAEIEETSLRKFLEIFATINQEFGNLFPILFPTGEGKLELTSPENPMLGGVEILCRLPGKSQKPMTLFSGGEKALTAMALIFALLKTKPTPFCFLDEVDAPLDEANVGRYNRVLEALSGQFQFIVITHNRRTMEVLDVLYGVTMQEPGVSKVVGVEMQKDLPAHLRKAFKQPVSGNRAVEGASSG